MSKKFENKHLEPLFNIVLPAIEKEGINYWVYGGIATAGIKGYFYRPNQDVDIFVMENDFEKTVEIVKFFSDNNSWRFEEAEEKLLGIRPKYELFIKNEERLSLVPIYERDGEVEFIFENGPKKFEKDLLKPFVRYIGAYKFITPSEDPLKELLRCYLECFFKSESRRNNKKLWKKRKLDADQLLGKEEAKRLFELQNPTENN